MRHLFAPIALSLALGACANFGTRGTQPTAFDGTYAGTVDQIAASSGGCVAPRGDGKLVVENGMVIWANSPSGQLFAPVASDGSFAASTLIPNNNSAIWLTGKITNKEMVARVNTGACHSVYDLHKSA